MRIGVSLLTVTFLLTACERSSPAPSSERKLTVVATVYPLADIARQVGGEVVEASWVVESGQSMRGVQPDARLRNLLRTADLVLMGDVTEAWATEGSGSGAHYARILRLETLPVARQAGRPGCLWLDPLIVRDAARELSSRLQAMRPRKISDLIERTDALLAKIDELHEHHQTQLRSAQNRRLLVLGSDFAPLLSRYSFQPVATIDVPPTRLTDENIRLLQYISRQNNTNLLVLPADTPGAVIEDIRLRSGLQILLLDALGSSAAGGRNTYLDLMRWNLEQLLNATAIH